MNAKCILIKHKIYGTGDSQQIVHTLSTGLGTCSSDSLYENIHIILKVKKLFIPPNCFCVKQKCGSAAPLLLSAHGPHLAHMEYCCMSTLIPHDWLECAGTFS